MGSNTFHNLSSNRKVHIMLLPINWQEELREFLDAKGIKYVTISHSTAFTAQDIAASANISGKELAKTVIIKIDGRFAMVVLPASYRIDFDVLRQCLGADKVELAAEHEFEKMFPECDIGAMPPFGPLYGMETYISERLREDQEIAFNAGSHTELMKMAFHDFEQLVKPKVIAIC